MLFWCFDNQHALLTHVLASLCHNSFNETKKLRVQSFSSVAFLVLTPSRNKMACIFLRSQEFATREIKNYTFSAFKGRPKTINSFKTVKKNVNIFFECFIAVKAEIMSKNKVKFKVFAV